LEHVYYCFENAESHSFKLINLRFKDLKFPGGNKKKRQTFPTPEIIFPSNWMADVYARNYIESIFSKCYYLICIGIIFRIFRSRCHRELLWKQIVLKI